MTEQRNNASILGQQGTPGLPPQPNHLPPSVTAGSNVPAISRAEYAKEMFGLDLPQGEIPLPSMGVAYPSSHPLHMKEVVAVKGLTTKEFQVMTNPVLIKNGKMGLELARSALLDKRIQPETLLEGDYMSLLYGIRVLSFSSQFSPELEEGCPKCKMPAKLNINLNDDLEPKNFDQAKMRQVVSGENLFETVLPNSGKVVQFELPTYGMVLDIEQNKDMKARSGLKAHTGELDLLARIIRSFNGKPVQGQDLVLLTEMLPAGDAVAIMNCCYVHGPKVDSNIMFQCDNPKCGHSQKMQVPVTAEFFRPTN